MSYAIQKKGHVEMVRESSCAKEERCSLQSALKTDRQNHSREISDV